MISHRYYSQLENLRNLALSLLHSISAIHYGLEHVHLLAISSPFAHKPVIFLPAILFRGEL
jgi:hypothetical protein